MQILLSRIDIVRRKSLKNMMNNVESTYVELEKSQKHD